MARGREVEPADAPGAAAQQLTVVAEVGREEDDEQHLGRLAGLEVERAEVDPQARAVRLVTQARHERQQQRTDPEREEGRSVAAERVDPAYEPEGQAEHTDPDHDPHGLRAGDARRGRDRQVEARDHHEADAVEQRDDGQQGRVRVRGEAADREVRNEEQADDHGEEQPEVCGQGRCLREGEQQVAADRHEDRHDAEPELGGPTGRGQGRAGPAQFVGPVAPVAPDAPLAPGRVVVVVACV